MRTIAEETILPVLDDETGKVNPDSPVHSLRNAVSGALLLDLAFNDRIGTTLHRLTAIGSTPLDQPVLDPHLACIVAEGGDRPTGHWVRLFPVEWNTPHGRACLSA